MSDEQNSLLGWVLGGVATVIAALTTTLTHFYKQQVATFAKREDELVGRVTKLETEVQECRDDREILRVEIAELRTEVRFIKEKTE